MNPVLLTTADLPTFLNWLFMEDIQTLTIDTPWLKEPILEVVLEEKAAMGRVHSIMSKKRFLGLHSGSRLTYSDIPISLVASGVVRPVNWDESISDLKRFTQRDLLRGNRVALIAMDTSALMRRYFTLIDREIHPQGKESRAPGYGYLVASGVRSELIDLEFKYKQAEIKDLTNHYDCAWFDFRGFTNQPTDAPRKFWLGSVDAAKMLTSGVCMQCESQQPTYTKEGDKDLMILQSLANYRDTQKVDIIAVAEDDQFIASAHKLMLQGVRLDRPSDSDVANGEYDAGWTALCDMFYVLSVVFGAIRLKWGADDYLLVQGIWPGKKEETWNSETLSLSTDNSDLYELLNMALVLS